MALSNTAPFVHYENRFIKIHLVPMFNDNYGYIFTDKVSKLTGCVDPGDGNAITNIGAEFELYIMCT
jgi:hypothetical protein